MNGIDWTKIKTEYVTTGISQRELANKYNLSLSGISKRAKAEGWVKRRQSYQNRRATKVERKVIERDVEKAITQLDRLSKATDRLLEKVEIAIEQLDRYVLIQTTSSVKNEKLKSGKKKITTKREKLSEGKSSIIDRKGLQEISTTLKNIKDIIAVTGDGGGEEGGGVIEIAAVMERPAEDAELTGDIESGDKTEQVNDDSPRNKENVTGVEIIEVNI